MNKGTIIRTIALFITWANVALEQAGLHAIPVLSDEEIALGITFVVSVWAWFKNNYLTAKGKKQREYLENKGLK